MYNLSLHQEITHSVRQMSIVYPVSRLLAQPKVFNAIANYFNGPDAETIRSSFYDLLEIEFEDEDADDCEFEAQEVHFDCEDDGAVFMIQLDTGVACKLEAVAGEVKGQVSTESDLKMTSTVYQKLVSVIEDSFPELKGDIALCSPPTPGNNFLTSEDGDCFIGSFHLKSNPEKKYSFNVLVVDSDSDEMKATIKPM